MGTVFLIIVIFVQDSCLNSTKILTLNVIVICVGSYMSCNIILTFKKPVEGMVYNEPISSFITLPERVL